jgi:O-antigen/teichoic acid export membrane protein
MLQPLPGSGCFQQPGFHRAGEVRSVEASFYFGVAPHHVLNGRGVSRSRSQAAFHHRPWLSTINSHDNGMRDASSAKLISRTAIQGGPAPSTRDLALSGAWWTVMGFGGAQVLRFAFNLILTHLLFPELFGLMALVFTILAGINLFCELGTNAIVVSHPRGADPEFPHTIWTVQILRGCCLAIACFLIASPVASFYGDYRLHMLIPLIGITSAIAGFNATTLLVMRRQMRVKKFVFLEFGAQALSGSVMVVWAWIAPGIPAIVAGSFASAVIRLVWGHLLKPRPSHRLAFDRGALHVLFTFGRWLWLAAILGYLASQIDRLILGKVLTLQMLGIYGVALAISELPRALLSALGGNVVFPAYSKWAGLPRDEFRTRIRRFRWPLLAAAGVVVLSLAVGGDIIVRCLYDKRYAPAGWMLPLLAIGIWPSALYQTIEGALVSVGQPRYGAFANLCKVVFTGVGIPLAFLWGGALGAVVVVALNDLPACIPLGYGLWRERLSNFGQDLKATALLLLALAFLVLMRWLLGFGLAFESAAS